MRNLLSCCCGLLLAAASTHAQVIAQWTFESTSSSITGTAVSLSGLAPETGTGSASGLHASASTAWSSPAGNGSSHSFSANNWAPGDYYQFQTSTLGFNNIQLSWDQTSSGTGPGKALLEWSTDGSTFTAVGSDYTILANAAPNPTWSAGTAQPIYTMTEDLSSIAALNNQGTVYFRLVDDSTSSANGGTVGTGGTDRVDNFTVSSVVPEPSTIALACLGSLGLVLWRRRS